MSILVVLVSSSFQQDEEETSDFYSVLDLTRSATIEEINEKFKTVKERYEQIQSLVQDESPQSDETLTQFGFNRSDFSLLTEQYSQMTKAYETLSDPTRKQIYDQFFRIGIYLRKEWGWKEEDLEFLFNLLVGYGIAFVVIAFLMVIVGILLIFLFGLIIWAFCCVSSKHSNSLEIPKQLDHSKVLEKDKIE
ncbi:DnaJ domain-containing protein [Naegleria gruberi]|uniref:DnaJ domain-containing protein n=1 Tax=Naegleria gruberi TaxID=5762 RepID=D2W393_NAEGR|nr:DnaJ domain-containing protein [Naegleria gruberi]EFC36474.1 DnaJ domain-containing protein [Naegleria gruberi]|eukprot:XP_002669218.1 DnaJ domain-containing protein [Naegleria gruberi strain NEG-M]